MVKSFAVSYELKVRVCHDVWGSDHKQSVKFVPIKIIASESLPVDRKTQHGVPLQVMNCAEEMKQMAFGEPGRETAFLKEDAETQIEGDGVSIFDQLPLRKMTLEEKNKVIEDVQRGVSIVEAIQDFAEDLPVSNNLSGEEEAKEKVMLPKFATVEVK